MQNSDTDWICPACGSSECSLVVSVSHIACPKCNSKLVVGIVKERSLEFALVEWTCAVCMHTWSDSCVFPEKFGVNSMVWSVKA